MYRTNTDDNDDDDNDDRNSFLESGHHNQEQPTLLSRSPPLFWLPAAAADEAVNSFASFSPNDHVYGVGGVRGSTPIPRLLSETRGSSDGTLAVLMIVCALFCFIWAPVMLRRCRGPNSLQRAQEDIHDLARFEAEARAMRATLQRMTLMGTVLSGGAVSTNGGIDGTPEDAQQLEHRREFLDNALLTKKVLFQSEEEQKIARKDIEEDSLDSVNAIGDNDESTAVAADKDSESEERVKESANTTQSTDNKARKAPRRQKSNVIVVLNTTKHTKANSSSGHTPAEDDSEGNCGELETVGNKEIQHQQSSSLEPCSICLADYDDGDDICWSQNDKCNHFFHKECIQTWLLTHEECPCCRQDFLHLWGDEEDDLQSTGGGGSRTVLNGRSRRRFSDGNAFDLPGNSFFRPARSASLRSISGTDESARGRRDWVEELAIEIQDRILERQRELQVEFYRREQEERQRQFISSLMLGQQSRAATLNHHNSSLPVGSPSLNSSARSTDNTGTGWLLYRHFPFNNFGNGTNRRQQTSNAGPTDTSVEEESHNDEDVRVADLRLPRGLEPWQTYNPDDNDPVVSSPTGARTPTFLEMVERSARRLGEERLPPRQPSQPTSSRFLNAGNDGSRHFLRRASTTSSLSSARVTMASTRVNAGPTSESERTRSRNAASRSIEDTTSSGGAHTVAGDEEICNSADA